MSVVTPQVMIAYWGRKSFLCNSHPCYKRCFASCIWVM